MSQRLPVRRLGRALVTVALAVAATVGGVDIGAGAATVSPVTPVHAVAGSPGADHAR